MSASDERNKWMVVGIAEMDPPRYSWRPLRAILSSPRDPSLHRWTYGSETLSLMGADLPGAVFESRVSEGFVTKVDEPVTITRDHVVVRNEDGCYVVRSVDDVKKSRNDFLIQCICEALDDAKEGNPAQAAARLELARLAEDYCPMATICLGGLAIEHQNQEWAQPLVEKMREIVPFLDLDIMSQSLVWDDLPERERRENWLTSVMKLGMSCRKPLRLDALFPNNPLNEDLAVMLLSARELFGKEIRVLNRITHRDLLDVVRADHAAVENLIEGVRKELDLGSPKEVIDELNCRLARRGDVAEQLSAVTETRVRKAEWERQAAALARIEATVGDLSRFDAWRTAVVKLNRSSPRAGLEPWQAGEACARALSAFFFVPGDRAPRRLAEWARISVGLAAPATEISDPEVDSCHVVSRHGPAAAFLDSKQILKRGTTTRFAIAKALGFQALGASQPGAHLSHSPDQPGCRHQISRIEQSANAFAAYFIAPREAVCKMTHGVNVEDPEIYADKVNSVMQVFGMTFSAAFSHVANCHRVKPPERISAVVRAHVDHEATERTWEDERLPVPPKVEGLNIPMERMDGFASLMSKALRQGRITMENAERLLGGPPERARAYLQSHR